MVQFFAKGKEKGRRAKYFEIDGQRIVQIEKESQGMDRERERDRESAIERKIERQKKKEKQRERDRKSF